jgi:hypothetical protein
MSSTRQLADLLRSGGCPGDGAFDRFLPDGLREASGMHWTPLEVAVRAARWFERAGVSMVVDIGSGAGKFCVAAALVSGARFVGVEQRGWLVAAAAELAARFEVADRVTFVEGTFGVDPLPVAGAYYLFNPFGENLLAERAHLDEAVELGRPRHARDVAALERMLEGAPGGTLIVTYNGFGGDVPAGFESLRLDRDLPHPLQMWRKAAGGV